MWFVCFGFFVLSSALPFGGRSEMENYSVQLVRSEGLPRQRHSICLPSPILGQMCLPSALDLFMPLRTLAEGPRRCLSIPVVRAYVVKVCPPETEEGNPNKSSKEITEEVKAETERVPDKADVEVNDEEVEFWGGNEESKVEDKNLETENKISEALEEIEVCGESNSRERPPTDKSAEDENISITSNII